MTDDSEHTHAHTHTLWCGPAEVMPAEEKMRGDTSTFTHTSANANHVLQVKCKWVINDEEEKGRGCVRLCINIDVNVSRLLARIDRLIR